METLVLVEQNRNQYSWRMNVKHHYGAGRVVSPTKTVTRGLRGINCRTFQSGAGILPTPIECYPKPATRRGYSSPPSSAIVKAPSPSSVDQLKSFAKSAPLAITSKCLMSEVSFGAEMSDGNVSLSAGKLKNSAKSAPIAIKSKPMVSAMSFGEELSNGNVSSSAGKLRTSAKSAPIAIKSKRLVSEMSFGECISNGNVSFSELWAGPAYSNSPPPSLLPMPKSSLLPKRTVSLELPSSAQDFRIEMPPTAKSAPASPTREHSNNCFGAHNFATKDLCRMLNLEIVDD